MKLIVTIIAGACLVASCETQRTPATQRSVGVTDVHPGADATTRSIAEREVARREQAVRDARALLDEGKSKYSDGDLEGAVQSFKKSIDTHP